MVVVVVENSLQDNFVFPPILQVCIDGKIRKQWGQKIDFLAVCVTGKGMEKEKFLGDVPVPTGSGENMANATYRLLLDWAIVDATKVFGFDTTTSMTGGKQGY